MAGRVLVNSADWPEHKLQIVLALYHNNQDALTDVTRQSGLAGRMVGMGRGRD